MGDSLDDFFAKKDKKKNKVKSKITPSDILCKSDVDQIKKLKKKNDKEQLGGVGLSTEAENEVAKKQAAVSILFSLLRIVCYLMFFYIR